jgi:hypothetical protein
MATLQTQQIGPAGLTPVYVAAAGGGDEFEPGNRTFFHIKNGDASSHTVTFVTPGTAYGQAIADETVTVPAGAERMIGRFPAEGFAGSDSLVSVTYSAVTSVTVGVFQI